MNGNILSSVAIQINYRYKDELIMEIKEKTNEKAPEKVVNKTTETLIKELETLSDKSLYEFLGIKQVVICFLNVLGFTLRLAIKVGCTFSLFTSLCKLRIVNLFCHTINSV